MGGPVPDAEDDAMTESQSSAGAGTPGATAPPPAPPAALAPTRPPLRRSRTDRKIAGVAGGLGRYTDIDPLVFRVVLAVLAVFGGSGILLYALGWLLVPEEGADESEMERLLHGRATSRAVAAVLLAVVGVAAVGQLVGTGFGVGGVLALAAVAVAAVLVSRSGHPASAPGTPAPAGSAAAPGAYGQTAGTAYTSAGPLPATGSGTPPPGTPYGPPPPAAGSAPPPPAAPRERSLLGRVTVSVALLVAGALAAWNAATSHDVGAATVLAAALGIVGVGLLVGAFVGRARGLVALGVVLLAATAIASTAHLHVDRSTGDRRWVPASTAAVHSPYRLGAGDATLDLSSLDVPAGQTVSVEATVGAGRLLVLVPPGAALDVKASAGVGHVLLPAGHESNGLRPTETYAAAGAPTAGTIELDLSVGVGDLEVRRAAS